MASYSLRSHAALPLHQVQALAHRQPALMPIRPLGWCTIPGCTNRANGRCADHGGSTTGARPSRSRRGYTNEWATRARRYLELNPHCEHDGCTALATQVHHVPDRAVLVAQHVTDPDAEVYLHGLCDAHHALHTLHDQ